jgi:transketolase
MYRLASEQIVEPIAMRDVYAQSLIRATEEDERVVVVEADIMASMGTTAYAKKFPAHSINCGIQEANAVGVCAGLSVTGFIPFFNTFAVFATRRVYDQAFLSCGYAKQNVKLVGADAGVTAAMNGGTHMPFEDIGIMRNIPQMTIVEPADSTAMAAVVSQMAKTYGNFYLRFGRKNAVKIYEDDSELRIGKASILREGNDVTIIACGIMVAEALKAAQELDKKGISACIVDMFTIKPIDKECILEYAKKTGAIVTAENHNVINGLGSAVSEVLTQYDPVPLERVGVQDEFGEVGDQKYLMERFGLTAGDIVEKAMKAYQRKR